MPHAEVRLLRGCRHRLQKHAGLRQSCVTHRRMQQREGGLAQASESICTRQSAVQGLPDRALRGWEPTAIEHTRSPLALRDAARPLSLCTWPLALASR